MTSDAWQLTLVVALGLNAVIGFGYRVYRLTKGGPVADVIGQAILGIVLVGLAMATAVGAGWPRWAALVYALLFGVAVMPVWVLAVLIPLQPRGLDYAFTGLYWVCLAAIAIAAVLI
ncbi:MAG: hypothetical protein QOG04_1585 [Actinomycetota bacterium]|jgi:hypothetical protein|nr:hypothetical protein [Actinomycetota bacterium]